MIRFRSSFAVPCFALALTACAKPPAPPAAPATQPAAAAQPEKPAQPAFKKKPMLNGRGKVTSISLEQFFLLQQSDKALIFDARPAFFYSIGHIPGAIHLPKNNCDERIHKREAEIKSALANGKSIVVYCSGHGCPDARTVAMHLSGFGYPAAVFSGGWDTWKESGMPTE